MKYATVTLEVEIADDLVYAVQEEGLARHNLIVAAKVVGRTVAIAVDDEPAEKEIVDV